MSRRASSRVDLGKAFIIATSHGDDSSDDEIALVGEQAVQVL